MSNEPIGFDAFKLNKQLLDAVAESGYTVPTPIQEQTIPLALAGHDVLGIAQTGTGKTAAYLLPLLMKIKYAQGMHPRGVVLAPTRELVMQIEEVAQHLAKYTGLRIASLYGGLGPKTQSERVEAGVDLLISTPGRFMDLYRKGAIYTKDLKTMVLDEADKMMDMGFMPQIRAILEVIPSKRQNLLFSATFSGRIDHLAAEFLEFPERVEIAPSATTAETIAQVKYLVPNIKTKINLLAHLLENEEINRAMIFTRSRKNAESVYSFLERKHFGEIRVIHANKGQNTRINSMEDFKAGDIAVAIIFGQLFGRDFGLINTGLGLFGIERIDFVENSFASHVAVATMITWRWVGYNALIFLAAMLAIPDELYESAALDGAGAWKQFLYVTLPGLKNTITFVLIVGTIGGLQVFAEPLVFSGTMDGGSSRQLSTMTMFLFEQTFINGKWGYGAAIGIAITVIVLIISVINFVVTRRVASEDKK